MTEEEKLIAEYMGLIPYKTYGWTTDANTPNGKLKDILNSEIPEEGWYTDVRFHESWDWLMTVIDKIEEKYDTEYVCLIPQFEEDTKYQFQIYISGTNITGNDKFQCYYKAVIEYIKWDLKKKK